MSKRIFLIILAIHFVSCSKDDNPCETLVDGVYQFPELPESHDMTSEEVTHYWDLPEKIGECILTEGLIETCLNYPDLRLIMAGYNPQHGYDLVNKRFLGTRLLETRPDRGTNLLKKYKTIDPLNYDPSWELLDIGRYVINIDYYEIIFSQFVNLESLTDDEIVELLETAFNIYIKKKNDLDIYGVFSLECTSALLGRLMLQEEYEPFLRAYEENIFIRELVHFYGPVNIETTEFILELSNNFLNQLKNY